MSLIEILVLLAGGMAAGGVNAIAGGATLLSFPILLSVGLPPTVANASNFVAVLPGNAAALPAYRKELKALGRQVWVFTAISLVGSAVGSGLLLASSDALFLDIIPFLIFAATIMYAFGARFNGWLARWPEVAQAMKSGWIGKTVLFAFSIYSGYFGAGAGVIVLSVLAIMGFSNFHQANALKNFTLAAVTLLGVIIFAFGGLISWPHALVMMAGATIGGYSVASIAHKVPQAWLKNFVIAFGLFLSVYYLFR